MKLIGVEVRVRASGAHTFREAKLVPLEIVIPAVDGRLEPEAEVTFHTTHGDVTVRTNLPGYGRYVGRDDGRYVGRDDEPNVPLHEAVRFIDRQIEAGL